MARASADIQLVAFDFDGTLADTRAAILGAAAQTLRELGLPPIPEARFVPMIGLPLRDAFVGAGVADDAADACVVRYRACFPAHAARVTLFPAVRACLEALSARRLTLGIVSSRGRSSLRALANQLAIAEHFRAILGDEDVPHKKPAPDLVLALCARVGVEPARTLVVGDTSYDIEMGHAACARTCAVTYGSHDLARLEAARPTYRLDSLAGLEALLTP